MPVLTEEILDDVLVEMLKQRKKFLTNLHRFMACGKEPLNAAQQYFRRVAYGVEYFEDYVRITTVDEIRVNKIFRIPYIFAFIQPILYAVGQGAKKIMITSSFPRQHIAAVIMDTLTGTSSKEVHYSTNIPTIFYQCLDRFDKTTKFSFCRLNDLSIIHKLPLSCKSLEIFACNFTRIFNDNNNIEALPQIEGLCFRGDFNSDVFAKKDLKQISIFISLKFPNLKKVNIEFDNLNQRNHYNPANKKFELQSSLFNELSPNVQGSIKFLVKTDRSTDERIDIILEINPNLTFKYEFVRY